MVIFQPAEEGGGGGKRDGRRRDDGPLGHPGGLRHAQLAGRCRPAASRSGPAPFFAATDQFEITVDGKGGHAAKPHETVDPTVVASQIVLALQTIASRNADPVDQVVVSVTSFETSSKAFNVIPQRVVLRGTIRTMSKAMRELAETRLKAIADATAEAFGARAEIDCHPRLSVDGEFRGADRIRRRGRAATSPATAPMRRW